MCGIVGIYGNNWSKQELEAMLAVQHHRGPDAEGTYISDNQKIGLGHNRLSIIDLSENGRQPMSNADGTVWIVFNGEVYNYRELYKYFPDYNFRSKTDTELIIAAYEKWGEKCVDYFIGMFSFAIYDVAKNKLFCVRDRIGIKPFNYTFYKGNLYFSSEIKAILAAGVPAYANMNQISAYLTQGLYEHDGNTFFKDIYELPAGHFLICQDGKTEIKPYWNLQEIVGGIEEDNNYISDYKEQLEELLLNSMKLRLRSDVALGLHLTGGLDSSAVVSFLGDLLPKGSEMHAFTGIYGSPQYDETIYSNAALGGLDVKLHEALIDKDNFWEVAEKVQYHQDQPFGGVATMVYWNMEKLVKKTGITVILEGQGGDELFGGYAYYVNEHYADILQTRGEAEANNFLRQYARFHGLNEQAFIVKTVKALQNKGTLYQDGSSFIKNQCLLPGFASQYKSEGKKIHAAKSRFTNARVSDLTFNKLPRVLRFNDRMSMSASCELRVPILDHRIIEFSFRIPNSEMIKNGVPKYPLREATGSKRLPDSVRMAPKRAVVTPQREWFRTFLKNDIEEKLRNSALEDLGILSRKAMLEEFNNFCNDPKQDNSFFIWQWLNLDLWFKTFKVNV